MTSKAKILYLDDDRYEMMPLIESLEHAGYDVTFLQSPEKALALLETDDYVPDLIISDLKMQSKPGMEEDEARHVGLGFCRRVREELDIRCPIIVVTVVADPTVHQRLRAYVNEILVKTVLPRELLECVKKQLP